MAIEDFEPIQTYTDKLEVTIKKIIPKDKLTIKLIHKCRLCHELIKAKRTYCVIHSLELAEVRSKKYKKKNLILKEKKE